MRRAPAALLLLLAAKASAMVRIEVDRDSVPYDGQFTVRLTFPGTCYLGQFPESPQYQVVSDQTDTVQKMGRISINKFSSQIQRQAGGYELRRTFVLKPAQGGVIAIEPIPVQCSAATEKTFRKTIRVVGGPALKAAAPAQPPPPQAKEPEKTTVNLQNFSNAGPIPQAPPEPKAASPTPAQAAEPAPEPSRPLPLLLEEWAKRQSPVTLRTLRLVIVAGFALGLAVLLVPWNALKAWWFVRGLKTFAKKRQPPQIAIRRETDLIGGKYKIEGELSSGGMGLVYQARDVKLSRPVAVKKMRAELQYSPEERSHFIREAMTMSRLSHPFIVGIHEVIEQDGEVYMVLDYIDGKPLSSLVDRKKSLSLKECRAILANVCQAVDFAHRKGILHQDLKPSNIMVDDNGFAKVMDFGLAQEAGAASNDASGTAAYMAPERQTGAATAACDVYSLGICLYEMLAGRLPFPGPQFQAQKERMQYVPLTQLKPELSPAVDALMARALAADPRQRIQGAQELLDGINALG